MPPGPTDWGGTLNFPIYGNDQYGDCGEAMACHGDQTFTGALGKESAFDTPTIVKQYEAVSGGDNGLSEDEVVNKVWKPGIAGVPGATIADALDIPVDPATAASAIYHFGCVCMGFSVPDAWIQSFSDTSRVVWDAPCTPDPSNGHFVALNGTDAGGRFVLRTWGGSTWLASSALKSCDAGLFTVFSLRWFSPTGYAPNGKHYTELAALWHALGGAALPPSPFPAPAPMPPTPSPTPGPTPAPTPQPTPQPALGPHQVLLDTEAGTIVLGSEMTAASSIWAGHNIAQVHRNPLVSYGSGWTVQRG